jgi:hypothetical protein
MDEGLKGFPGLVDGSPRKKISSKIVVIEVDKRGKSSLKLKKS